MIEWVDLAVVLVGVLGVLSLAFIVGRLNQNLERVVIEITHVSEVMRTISVDLNTGSRSINYTLQRVATELESNEPAAITGDIKIKGYVASGM